MATRLNRSEFPTVIYLYGISTAPATLPVVIGVDGLAPVEVSTCAGLSCWISYVPQLDFAENLAANMENLDWLSDAGVRHQRVVSMITKVTDILPARFGTVFLNLSSLEADIRRRKKALLKDLSKIKGCEEWGIKVFTVQPLISLPMQKPKTGKEYLKTKAALLRRPDARIGGEELELFAEALQKISVAAAEGGRISGGQKGLQWQTSLLLKRGDQHKLNRILKKYAARWTDSGRIECTGPWPPYSFVSKPD